MLNFLIIIYLWAFEISCSAESRPGYSKYHINAQIDLDHKAWNKSSAHKVSIVIPVVKSSTQ